MFVIAAIVVGIVFVTVVVRGQSHHTVRAIHLAPNVTCADPECKGGYNVVPYVRTHSQYGIGCMGNVPPGTTPNPVIPPESYSVSDMGKPGFPEMTTDERAMVYRIQRYVHSRTLRIAWMVEGPPSHEFIVFDAAIGPCEVGAPGYKVLNGGCNEYYQPGENPYHTAPAPDCFPKDLHPPWMTPTRGAH